jgi:hypothetical protein
MNGLRKLTMELYSAIRKNAMSFAGNWMELKTIRSSKIV